jgi:hypothetical protein
MTVSLSDKGWKGVRVGVASTGAVTRNRVVGEAAGNPEAESAEGAAQPVNKIMVSTIVRSVCLMTFLLLIEAFDGRHPLQARSISRRGYSTRSRQITTN